MNHIIENDKLICTMETQGAQLLSLMFKENGKEYIWQGNPSVWMWHAPVLFPICGNFPETGMRQHGFLRDVEHLYTGDGAFLFRSKHENYYPYQFTANTSFRLEGLTLIHRLDVTNTEDKPMPFSMGFHTGFELSFPMLKFDNPKDYTFHANNQNLSKTLFFTDERPHSIVCTDTNGKALRWESSGYTTLVLWTASGHASDYICIEPRVDTIPTGAKEPFARILKPGKTTSLEERITILS